MEMEIFILNILYKVGSRTICKISVTILEHANVLNVDSSLCVIIKIVELASSNINIRRPNYVSKNEKRYEAYKIHF